MEQTTTRLERLTVNDLRLIETGETKTFALPDARACRSGKALGLNYEELSAIAKEDEDPYAHFMNDMKEGR